MSGPVTAFRFGSALSDAPDTTEAITHIADQLQHQDLGPPDVLFVTVTPHHRDQLDQIQRVLARRLNTSQVLGVTAEGVIGQKRELQNTPGISVLAAHLPGVTARAFTGERIDWQAVADAPQALREDLPWPAADADLRAVVLLADPFSSPMTRILPAFNTAWPGVPVVGGMASAARAPGGNRLLINDRILRDGLVGLAIGGPIDIDCTVSQGCRPIGKPWVITKSQRHVVQQLGGRPALRVVQELIDTLSDDERTLAQSGGLLVGRVIDEYKERFGRGDFLIRGLMGVDHDAGYVAIGDTQVRVGQTIQFHVHDAKSAEEDFALLLELQKLHNTPAAGALLFSCNGRGVRLFDRRDMDATLVHDALGAVPLAGFFAAGELGPVGKQNFIHGHTACLVTFRASS